MLKGTLDDFTLPDIFRLMSLSKKTGSLTVQRSAGEGKVYFRDGEVYYAESSLSKEPLGQKLVRAKALTEGQLRKALDQHAGSGRRLGEVLLSTGMVDEEQIMMVVRQQIEDAAFDLLRWELGEFLWEPGAESSPEVPIYVTVENLIMEASRRLDELEVIQRKIPSADTVLAMAATPPEGAVEINITPEEWRILVLVNGTRNVREIGELVGLDDFSAMRTLYGLVSAGLIEVPAHHGSGSPTPDAGSPRVGPAAEEPGEEPAAVAAPAEVPVADVRPEREEESPVESDHADGPEPEREPVAEAQPVFEPEPVAEAQPVLEPEPAMEPVAEAQPVLEPEPAMQPVAEAQPVLEPEPAMQPVAEAQPVLEPEPAMEPVSEAQPVFEPKPQPEPFAAVDPAQEAEDFYSPAAIHEPADRPANFDDQPVEPVRADDGIFGEELFLADPVAAAPETPGAAEALHPVPEAPAFEEPDIPVEAFDAPGPGDLSLQGPGSYGYEDPLGGEVLGSQTPPAAPAGEPVAPPAPEPVAAQPEAPRIPVSSEPAGESPQVDRISAVRELAGLFSEAGADETTARPRPRAAAPAEPSGAPDTRKRVEDDEQVTRGLISRLIDGVKGL